MAVAAYRVAPGAPTKSGHTQLFLIIGGVLAAFMVALGITAQFVQQPTTTKCATNPCVLPPPLSPALAAPHSLTSSDLGFTLEYQDNPNVHFKVQDGHSMQFVLGPVDGGFPMVFNGERAAGRSAQQVVDAVQKAHAPGAVLAYGIPGSELGYVNGYGGVYDYQSSSPSGQSEHFRYIIEAAIKDGVVIEAFAVGPFNPPNPKTDGHPNPSLTQVSYFIDLVANTVRWKGDNP